MNKESDKFWAVWRKNGAAPPQKRHSTKAEAIEEASRLAQDSGSEYYILEVTGLVRPITPPIEYIEI